MPSIENPASVSKKIEQRSLADLKPYPLQHIYIPAEPGHNIQSFAETLRRGLDNPVEITPDGVVICGHRRMEAARFLGWRTIDCWVRHDLVEKGPLAIEERFLEDNAQRRQLSKLGAARCYQQLREIAQEEAQAGSRSNQSQGDRRDQIGQALGKSGRNLDRLLNILRTPPEVQQAFERGDLPLVAAEKVSRLAPRVQKEIADEIREDKNPRKAVEAFLRADAEHRAGYTGGRQALLAKWNRFMGCLRKDVATLSSHVADIPKPGPTATLAIDRAIAFLMQVKAEERDGAPDERSTRPDIVSGELAAPEGTPVADTVIQRNSDTNGEDAGPDIMSGMVARSQVMEVLIPSNKDTNDASAGLSH